MDLFILIKVLFFLASVLALAYFAFMLAKKKFLFKIKHQDLRIQISNYSYINPKTFTCIIRTDGQEFLLVSNGEFLVLEKLNITHQSE